MLNKKIYLIFTSVLIIFGIFLIHLFPNNRIEVYTYVYIFTSIIFIILYLLLTKTNINSYQLIFLLLLSLLLKISFVNTTPIGSDDIYRYIWDGKLQTENINPYQFAPSDSALNHLHSDILPAKVNFPDLKTIYFPFSEWLFYIGYSISGESVWGYKILIFLFEVFTFLFINLILKKLGKQIKYLLIYTLCPLTLIQFSVDAHLDAFGITLLSASIYFYISKMKLPSLILLGISLSIKPVGLLFLPIMFLDQEKVKDKIYVIFLPLFVFSIQFIPYIFSANPFEALFIYTSNWSFNGFIFKLIYLITHNNQSARIICGILLIISLIPIYISKRDIITKYYFGLFILFIFSPVVHPWYIGWIALLTAIKQNKSGIFYLSLSSLTSITIYNYILNGVWKEYWIVLLIQYLPVIYLFMLEIFSEISTDFFKKFKWVDK